MQTFSIGQTISRASSLIGTTLRSVGLFILILQAISLAVTYVLRGQLVVAMGGAEAMADPAVQVAVLRSGWYWVTAAWSTVLASLVFAGATAGMIKAEKGEAVSLGDCFAGGLPKMLPLIGLMILWMLGVYIGIILLVVPGCILLAMWSVTVPVLIAEDTGVFGAFGRSRALTKGYRWKIFLLLLIVLVLLYVGLGVILALSAVQLIGFGAAIYTSGPLQVIMGLFGAAFGLVIDAVLVAIYGELIELKAEHTGGVFD